MKVLVAAEEASFELLRELFARRGEMEAIRQGAPEDDSLALVWARSVEDTGEISRLAGLGWRVFAVSLDELRSVRAVLLNAGAEDVSPDPPSLSWIEACAESVKPSGNRREVRYVATVPWSLSRAGGPKIEGNLVNVSRGGFKVRLLDPPAVGEVLLANFSQESNVPPLYARVLSATSATPTSWWIRARFVALRTDEAESLERWLATLKHEDVDPVKALVAIDGMTARDLRSQSNAIGGVHIPALSSLERSWVSAGEGSAESVFAAIPVARTRASTAAHVLGSAPNLAFEPPIERWRAEIGRAIAMCRDPASISTAVGDVTAEPEAAGAFTDAAEGLEAAAARFEKAVKDFLGAAQRRESAAAASAPQLPVRPVAVVPSAPPAHSSSAPRPGPGMGKQRTAMSIAAEALAPKSAKADRGLPSRAIPARTILVSAGAGVGGLVVVLLLLQVLLGSHRKAGGAVVFEVAGVRVREVRHAPGPIAIVDDSWSALDDAGKMNAAAEIARKIRPGTVLIKDQADHTRAIVPEDGKAVLMGD